jgi:diguanylate cyclase (GGDEF)-like protein
MPAFLNPRRIEGRIVWLFLALLLLVQLASFGFIRQTIEANAESAIDAKLATAGRMMQRLLMQQAARERAAAELLAADGALRQVLGSGAMGPAGINKIRATLASRGANVGAEIVAFADAKGQLLAATRPGADCLLGALHKDANADGEFPAMALYDSQLLLLEAVPVQTVAPLGHVLIGFALDDTPLQDIKRLLNVDAMFVTAPQGQAWQEHISLLEDEERDNVRANMATLAAGETVKRSWAGQQWRARLLELPLRDQTDGPPDVRAAVALWASFDEEVAPYRQLQLTLLGLTLAGVATFALGSVFTARRISEPIASLAAAAERLGRGDYETPVSAVSSLAEVADLAQTFEAMRRDIRAREKQAHRLAYWDTLTGLPNREQFSRQLARQLAEHDGRQAALLMLDLDRFKHVNDVLGHAFGDRLLCGVAERLQALCPGRLIARLSGDEFALLLDGADEHAAKETAARILVDFETPLRIDEQTIDLGAGIGIALYPVHGQEVSSLLARAEIAMYAAKRQQSGSMVYRPSLDAASQDSLSLLGELRRAIEGGELRLYLQPKVDLRRNEVLAAEALVRWQHPQRGLVPPMQFIPFAERTGFIRALTAWVIEASADIARQAREAGVPLRLSVNLSARDLMDQDLPAKTMALLQRHGVPAEALCLEITESAIMDDPQRALHTLETLHRLGFKLSIDDFGTGYSSLAYLKRLPVQELKIDRSFVAAMERDADDARIVRSTIELAHNLGLSVVAEGVETAKTWKLLDTLGCDEAQGYYIGRPMPAAEFMAWLAQWQPPDLGDVSADTVLGQL